MERSFPTKLQAENSPQTPRVIFLGGYEENAQGRAHILARQALLSLRSVEWPSQSCRIDRIINAFCPKQSH